MMNKFVAPQVLVLVLVPLLFLSGSSQPEAPAEAAMEKAEREALFLAVQGFAGKWWNGWELYPDPCGWTPMQGVSCDLFDGLWYVTSLNIGPVLDNSLECSQGASFAPSLFDLRHLKTLSIYDCFSSSGQKITIPSLGWENLASSLETLEFRSNPGLTGGMPPGLGQLANLKSLVLVENSLSGELPAELGNLVHLKRLSLGGNMFSGQIPASVGYNLKELLIFDASCNTLTGPLPPSLGRLASLLKLDLSNNHLHGSLPGEIANLRNLTLLDLRNNNLSGGLSQALEGLAPMQDLLLSNNPLGGNLIEFRFEKLRNLTNLDLSNTGLRGTIPESITGLKRLRFLALDNNHLSGSIPPKLEDSPSLSALYVNANNLSGKLGFSGDFYGRMGRRFASWDNPGLCYSSLGASKEKAPLGVEECKDEGVLLYNSKNKMGEENPELSYMASIGFSESSTNGFWCITIVQDLAAFFLLVLFL